MAPLVARVLERYAGLVRTSPAKVLAFLKKHGFQAAIDDPKHGIFRDGVEVMKSPRPGWVNVQWQFQNTVRREDKKTGEDWRRQAQHVFDTLQKGPFVVQWGPGGESSGLIQVVEKTVEP